MKFIPPDAYVITADASFVHSHITAVTFLHNISKIKTCFKILSDCTMDIKTI